MSRKNQDTWRKFFHQVNHISTVFHRLTQERFLHRGSRDELNQPTSSLDYKWNVPISYVDAAGEYKLDWILTDKNLELRGYAGKDIWLDPESNAFVRFNYGKFDQISEVCLS